MKFRQTAAAVLGVLLLRHNLEAPAMFRRDAAFRDAVVTAVWERFREDDPDGGLAGFLTWIINHQEEILAIIQLLMVLFA